MRKFFIYFCFIISNYGNTVQADQAINGSCSLSAENTLQINYCAGLEFKQADYNLNLSYKTIITTLKQNAKDDSDSKNTLSKLVNSQRLWVKFRDAECSTQYAFYQSGTMRDSVFLTCKTKLTQVREKDLKSFYKVFFEI